MNVSPCSVQMIRFETEEHPHEIPELTSNISVLVAVCTIYSCLLGQIDSISDMAYQTNVFPIGTADKPLFGYYGFYLQESI